MVMADECEKLKSHIAVFNGLSSEIAKSQNESKFGTFSMVKKLIKSCYTKRETY
jgi:hypothetical protein